MGVIMHDDIPYGGRVPTTDPEVLVRDTVGWTGKNLLRIPSNITSTTKNGIEFTVSRNANGEVDYINANNNSQSNYDTYFALQARGGDYSLPAGTYKISGGINDDIFIYITDANNNSIGSTKAGENEFTLASNTNGIGIGIYIPAGSQVTNIRFYPMIRKASVLDPTYEPYHKNVEEYIPEIAEDKACLFTKDAVGWTGKNLIRRNNSTTNNGITFTVNEDNSVTVNGTATGTAFWGAPASIEVGDYIMNGCPLGGGANYLMDVRNAVGGASPYSRDYQDTGNGIQFHNDAEQTVYINIRIANGYTANNLTFYPMLRKASIIDDTYEPYHASVEEIVKDIRSEQSVLGAKNWFHTNTIVSKATDVEVTITEDGKTIRVNNTTAGSYKMVTFQMPVEKNTNYLFTSDVLVTSGAALVAISDSSGDIITKAPTDGKINIEFNSGDRTAIRVKMLCTQSTSEIGDITYSNNMLRLASDPDDTYVPYAMTNRELTSKISSCSEITGTATINSLSKHGNLVVLDLKITGLTKDAWNYFARIPEGYRPKYSFRTKMFDTNNNAEYQVAIPESGMIQAISALDNKDIILHAAWSII